MYLVDVIIRFCFKILDSIRNLEFKKCGDNNEQILREKDSVPYIVNPDIFLNDAGNLLHNVENNFIINDNGIKVSFYFLFYCNTSIMLGNYEYQ